MRRRLEILLVEDNPLDADLAKRAFQDVDEIEKVHWVQDGEEALHFFFPEGDETKLELDPLPHVILMDLRMPKMGGVDLLAALKKNPLTRNIPVIVLTSSSRDEDIRKCYELGANSYIVKPVDYDNYNKAITEIGHYWLILNTISETAE